MARRMTTSQDFANWVCTSVLEPRYLLHVLKHMGREWRRLQAGSSPTNKTLYMHALKRLQILLPPIDEQRAIADIGDEFDVRLEAERTLLIGLRTLKAALAQEMLAGRVRLPRAIVARHEVALETRAAE